MIERDLKEKLLALSKSFSVVIMTGPRQSGKTTLCKMAFPEYNYVNLEKIALRRSIESNPMDFLLQHDEGLIIDEAQLLPELFSYVQVVVDEHPENRYILTGSSNFSLMEKITQSLAGRAAVLSLLPLSLSELHGAEGVSTDELLLRGGYPAVWSKEVEPSEVYGNYYTTYVERDLRQLVNIKNLSMFQQFITLVAGRIGTEFNASSLAAEIGISSVTVQHWMSVLEASYIVFMLPPYFRNIGKRIVKSKKIYFYDTGLACFLLGIKNKEQLAPYPLRGQLFECLVVSEFMKRSYNSGNRPHLFFYRDREQKEVDVVEEETFRQLRAYEIKSARMYNGSFGAGLSYFKKIYGDEVTQTMVLYDGEDELVKQFGGFKNIRRFFGEKTNQPTA